MTATAKKQYSSELEILILESESIEDAVQKILQRPTMVEELFGPQLQRVVKRIASQPQPQPQPDARSSGKSRTFEKPDPVVGLTLVADDNVQDFMKGYQLSSGKVLGSATSSDLNIEINIRKSEQRKHGVHVLFLSNVSRKLGGSTVSSKFDEATLRRLFNQAKTSI